MFNTISGTYDGLNRVISWGSDIKWRKFVVQKVAEIHPTAVLDVATGTGDLAIALTEIKGVKMSILAKKSESNNLINTEEKNNNFLEITEYKENLEFEVLETFSEKNSDFIGKNDYQKVIEFTEKQLYLLNQAFTDGSEKIKIQNNSHLLSKFFSILAIRHHYLHRWNCYFRHLVYYYVEEIVCFHYSSVQNLADQFC